MDIDAENLKKHIPSYLSEKDQKDLLSGLKAIASGGTADYYLSSHDDTFKESMLQGDGWRGFQLFIFETGKRRGVRGIVLSNSCDVDLDNPRALPTRLIFAPLVKLSNYEGLAQNHLVG